MPRRTLEEAEAEETTTEAIEEATEEKVGTGIAEEVETAEAAEETGTATIIAEATTAEVAEETETSSLPSSSPRVPTSVSSRASTSQTRRQEACGETT